MRTSGATVSAFVLLTAVSGCSTGEPAQAPQQPVKSLLPKPSESLATPAPHQSEPATLFSSFRTSRISQEKWRIETGMVQPPAVTVQALDSYGEVLVRIDAALDWTRISGSEECGGDARSTTVHIDTD